MGKLLYTLILISFISLGAQSQPTPSASPNLEYRVYPGTITTNDGQTIKGYILNRRKEENQDKCIFLTDMNDGRTQKEYAPADLKGYTIENLQYKSVSYSGNISIGKPDRKFLFVAQPGYITAFKYYLHGEQIAWQKGDEEPISNSSMLFGFKKNILKLVGDDPELVAKINNKEKGYGMLGISTIIDEYNAWYAAKK